MKVRDIMTGPAVWVAPEESVAVAARTLSQYHLGALPVCDSRGKIQGLVTDQDLVRRCLAADRSAEKTRVADVMTRQVFSVVPDTELTELAQIMDSRGFRRMPVTQNGILQGMVSLDHLDRPR